MGTGPFTFVEHVKGSHWVGKKNPDYWDKGKPYLDGYRAHLHQRLGRAGRGRPRRAGARSSSAASARPSATASCRRSATRSPCRRARGTALILVAMQPREEAVRRQARAPGPDAWRSTATRARRRCRRSRSSRRSAASRCPARRSRRRPPSWRSSPATGRTSTRSARRGQAPAQGGRRARRLLVHVQEPRHPACPTSRSASG